MAVGNESKTTVKREQYMKTRRATLLAVLSTLWLKMTNAQRSPKVLRVGVLFGSPEIAVRPLIAEFEKGLTSRGNALGSTTEIVYVFSSSSPEQLRQSASDLGKSCDVLVAWGTLCAIAAKDAKIHLPVVSVTVGFPVEIGLAQSLRKPGGNFTGVSFEAAEDTYGKRIQMLKEMIPGLTRVVALGDGNDRNIVPSLASLHRVAPQLGIELLDFKVFGAAELAPAFLEISKMPIQAVVVIAGVVTFQNRELISEQALRYKLPSVHAFKEAVAAGALISLGPDLIVMADQSAQYVDKILHGASPAELPIEQPSRYEVHINLKSAKQLGIAVPASLLARADYVVQ